jgi:hypothetical protein
MLSGDNFVAMPRYGPNAADFRPAENLRYRQTGNMRIMEPGQGPAGGTIISLFLARSNGRFMVALNITVHAL